MFFNIKIIKTKMYVFKNVFIIVVITTRKL